MSLNYNDYAVATAPSSSIATGDTSIDVSDNTAYPNPPFLIDVFEGGSSPNDAVKQGGTVERMEVTATSGTGPYTWTVNRDANGHNGSAQSFTTSASVWHVQPASAMGPERAIVGSQLKTSSVTVYGDFQAPAADADGYTLSSGHSLTVQSGSAEVTGGALTPTSGAGQTIVTVDGLSGYSIATIDLQFINAKSSVKKGAILGYNGSGEFAFLSMDRVFDSTVRLRLVEESGGTQSEISNSNSITSQSVKQMSMVMKAYIKSSNYGNKARYFGGAASKIISGNGQNLSNIDNFDANSVGVLMGNDEVKITGLSINLR